MVGASGPRQDGVALPGHHDVPRKFAWFATRTLLIGALLVVLRPVSTMAAPGDACELNSECDSGEECRLQVCTIHKPLSTPPRAPVTSSDSHAGTGNVCMTQVDVCPLGADQRSGSICYCDTANGQVGGVVP
jgi:hypothetical protein